MCESHHHQGVIGWFRFDVTDSGVGISAEQQKAVFEEFTYFTQNKLYGGGKKFLTARY